MSALAIYALVTTALALLGWFAFWARESQVRELRGERNEAEQEARDWEATSNQHERNVGVLREQLADQETLLVVAAAEVERLELRSLPAAPYPGERLRPVPPGVKPFAVEWAERSAAAVTADLPPSDLGKRRAAKKAVRKA